MQSLKWVLFTLNTFGLLVALEKNRNVYYSCSLSAYYLFIYTLALHE